MKTTVSESDFIQAFEDMNRGAKFTYEGRQALFEYLEEFEDDTGQEIELDVIGLCCEYWEYASLKEFQAAYGEEYESMEDIEQATTVIKIDDDAFIIVAF